MNKNTFLKILKKQLRCLNASERQKNINYYDELIADMIENGFSEEAAVEKIGSPKQLAQEIITNTPPENMKTTDRIGRTLIGICLLTILLSVASEIRVYLHSSGAIIIGGADGPTSVFIAGRIGHFPRMWMIAGILVIVTIVYYLLKRRRRA